MFTDRTKWAAYWFTNRDRFHSTDWTKVKRTSRGRADYDFLVKCAYFACHQEDWSLQDFANEVGISDTTAYRWMNHFSSIYGVHLSSSAPITRDIRARNSRPVGFANILKR